MKNIKYVTEDCALVDEKIITIGSKDKYEITLDTCAMKIFRYNDGRTINEKHTYKMVSQACVNTDIVYIRTNDIILGVWGAGGAIKLWILRPVFRRG